VKGRRIFISCVFAGCYVFKSWHIFGKANDLDEELVFGKNIYGSE